MARTKDMILAPRVVCVGSKASGLGREGQYDGGSAPLPPLCLPKPLGAGGRSGGEGSGVGVCQRTQLAASLPRHPPPPTPPHHAQGRVGGGEKNVTPTRSSPRR